MLKVILTKLILLATVFSLQSQSIYKSFSNLERKDLYSAHKGFKKKLKRNQAEASLGLSMCYLEPSFLNIDSSLSYLLRAESKWSGIHQKSLEKLKLLGFDFKTIAHQKSSLGNLFFKRCLDRGTPECFENLLNTQPWNENSDLIKYYRDSLYYVRAKENKSTDDIKMLLDSYPESAFTAKLNALYDSYELSNSVSGSTEEEWASFIAFHPENRYAGPLQDSLYGLFDLNNAQLYHSFIEKYPANRNVEIAWERIYQLETNYYHPNLLLSFSQRRPEYPNQKQLEEDLERSRLQLYPFQDTSNSEPSYGYKNHSGAWVIAPRAQYEEPSFFTQGYAVIGHKGLYGIINKQGVEIVPFIYDEVEILDNMCILVSSGGLYGVLNRNGSFRHQLAYTSFDDIDSLYYVLHQGDEAQLYHVGCSEDLKDVPKDLELLDKGYYIAYGFGGTKVGLFQSEDSCNLVQVLSVAYGEINRFSEDSFVGELKNQLKIMDGSEEVLTDSTYQDVSVVQNGFALALKSNGSLGYLNKQAQEAIDFKYQPFGGMKTLGLFQDGHAIVKAEGSYGVIDTSGVYKVVPKYDQIIDLYGCYGVRTGEEWSIVSIGTDSIISAVFESLDAIGEGYILFKKNGKYGVLNPSLSNVFPPVYRFIKKYGDYFITLGCDNDLRYIMNIDGSLATTLSFEKVQPIKNNHLFVTMGSRVGYFRLRDGKLIMQ